MEIGVQPSFESENFIKKLELFEHGKYYICVMKVSFLHSGDPQGWLAVVGLAFKHSSELRMLPVSRNICRIYSTRNRSGEF